MSTDSAPYSVRWQRIDLIERNKLVTLEAAVYRDGALVAPTSGTVSVFNANNVAVVDEAAVVVSGSKATYALAAATTAPEDLGKGWRIVWTLLVAGEVVTARNMAALCRYTWYPPIADADLFRRVRGLDPNAASRITSLDDYQDKIDEADVVIQNRLIQDKRRPNLIMDASSLREVYLTLTLALIFEDEETLLNEAYTEHASRYREQYRDAWADLSFVYDTDDDGVPDNGEERTPATSGTWLM